MLFTDNRGRLCVLLRLELNQQHPVEKTDDLPLIYVATYLDELPQLLHVLLAHSIQLTKYLLTRGLLSDVSRPVSLFCNSTTDH